MALCWPRNLNDFFPKNSLKLISSLYTTATLFKKSSIFHKIQKPHFGGISASLNPENLTQYFSKKKFSKRLKITIFSCQKSAKFFISHSFGKFWTNRETDGWCFIERDYSKHFQLLQFQYLGLSPCKIANFCSENINFHANYKWYHSSIRFPGCR